MTNQSIVLTNYFSIYTITSAFLFNCRFFDQYFRIDIFLNKNIKKDHNLYKGIYLCFFIMFIHSFNQAYLHRIKLKLGKLLEEF